MDGRAARVWSHAAVVRRRWLISAFVGCAAVSAMFIVCIVGAVLEQDWYVARLVRDGSSPETATGVHWFATMSYAVLVVAILGGVVRYTWNGRGIRWLIGVLAVALLVSLTALVPATFAALALVSLTRLRRADLTSDRSARVAAELAAGREAQRQRAADSPT